MNEEVTYNQIISFARDDVLIRPIAKSYAEEGKLILVLDNSERILIEGKEIDTIGHKKRIQELLDSAEEKGHAVDPKAVKHYAAVQTDEGTLEYVLVKW
jgi:hypothetical protein